PSSLSPHSLPHFLLITPLPPISTLFPYTTLFRSLQAQHDRTPLDDRQHDHAKGRLQRRVLVKVVQHSEDLRLSLQLDQDAHAVAVRLVAQVGYAFELALGDELSDLGHEAGLVDRVRQLVDDDPLAPVCGLLERMPGTDDDPAVAG